MGIYTLKFLEVQVESHPTQGLRLGVVWRINIPSSLNKLTKYIGTSCQGNNIWITIGNLHTEVLGGPSWVSSYSRIEIGRCMKNKYPK